MGRGGRAKPWKSDAERGYELWRGSWSPALRNPSQRPWHRQDAARPDQQQYFPSYTSMQPQPNDRSVAAGYIEGTAQTGRAQGVQSLLNPARKAEQRLIRLQSARARTASQFEAFLMGLKKSFIKEMTKFQNDTARIDQAIAEATQEQEQAFATVRQAILGGAADHPGSMQQAPVLEEAWAKMTSTWEQEDGDFLQEVLRRGPPNPPQTAPTRQLTPQAQQLLAHFGASQAPMVGTSPDVPMREAAPTSPTIPPGLPQMGQELQELLRHFGASIAATTQPSSGAHPVTARDGDAPGNNQKYNGLDPALFEPCGDAATGIVKNADRISSNSISPGAKAKRALAAGALQRQPVKKHTKPTTSAPGQASLGYKLEVAREAAALKEAAEQAFHLSQHAAPSATTASPELAGAGAPTASGVSNAMRPFGRPTMLGPAAAEPPPVTETDTGSRKITIHEAGSDDDVDTDKNDPDELH